MTTWIPSPSHGGGVEALPARDEAKSLCSRLQGGEAHQDVPVDVRGEDAGRGADAVA